MKFVLCLLLAGLVGSINAQGVCDPTACSVPSDQVALLEAGNTEVTNHFYIGGMFSIHDESTQDPYEHGDIRIRSFVNMEAFFWAINKYGSLVSPVSVGGFAMDSWSRQERTLENVYGFETCRSYYTGISPRNTVAFVGPDRSGEAIASATLLKDLKRTQVSGAATSSSLSDETFQYFLRTVPSDNVETKVMAKLLTYKGVNRVQVLYEDTAYGRDLYAAFMENIEGSDVCITQAMAVTDDKVDTRNFLKQSMVTRVVMVLAGSAKSREILEAVNEDSAIKNQFFFIGTSSWGMDAAVIQNLDVDGLTIKLNTDAYYNEADVDEFWDRFFQWKPDTGSNSVSANINKHNPWFKELWEDMFNCNLDIDCDVDNQNLRNRMSASDTYVPYTLMAVESIIRGVKTAYNSLCQSNHLCSELLNRDETRHAALYSHILESRNGANSRFFQDNGDAALMFEKYKVVRVQNGTYDEVLRYETSLDTGTSSGFIPEKVFNIYSSGCKDDPCLICGEIPTTTTEPTTIKTTEAPDNNGGLQGTKAELLIEWREEILRRSFLMDQEFTGVWRRDQNRTEQDSKTRFANDHEWIIALGVCAGVGIVCVLVFEIYILYKLMGTKIGKQWRTMWLGQLLLFGIFLAYLVCFAYLWTPTKVTCGITRFGVGVTYAMCFAVLLVKLMVLLTSKTSADTLLPGDVDSPNYLRGIYQFLMYLFIVGVQVVIAIQWLIMVPPDAVQVMSNNGELVWICNHYTWTLEQDYGWHDMTMFVRTNFENHLITLTYVMFLILLTVIIAMKSHGIITNHRESVFIGIAAGFSVPVFVAWSLVGGLNKDNEYAQEFGDASFAFGLLIVATIIMFAMFLPKVRQLVNMGVEGIYLEDDRDTYYAGSVVMAPPSYKSRPSSVVYVNNNGYSDPVVIGDPNHLKHTTSTYSAPVYVKRPESTIGGGSGKVLKMTGDLTGKHPRDSRKSTSEAGYAYAGSGYGTYRKSRSESGGTLRKSVSHQDLGAL